jgi:hypothetical protein
MAMPRVVAEDDDDDDGSVPRDAVRRRSSPDIKKLTMPLDRICLGVEIIIFQCVTTTMGRRVESSPMEFLVLARRQQIMLARQASQTYICVCSFRRTLAWPGVLRVHQQNFCHSPNSEFTTNCSSSEKDEGERNFTEGERFSIFPQKRAELRYVNRRNIPRDGTTSKLTQREHVWPRGRVKFDQVGMSWAFKCATC